LTFKPAAPKLILRTGAIHSVERPDFPLTGTLTQEVRAVLERQKKSSSDRTGLNYTGMNDIASTKESCFPSRTQSMPVRPNFFIPILSVGSYVLPFFMMMFVGLWGRCVPGVPWLYEQLCNCGYQIELHKGKQMGYAVLAAIVLPMLTGALLAYFLSKNKGLNIKIKLTIWIVFILFLCYVEYFAGAFFRFT